MAAKHPLVRALIFTLYALFLLASAALAQEYVLEPGDKLSIHFWQEPTLDVEVVVDNEGKIVIPAAGRMTAAGLAVSQLEAKIVQQINIYNRNVTQALVKVIEYGSKKIFVTGAVLMPGPLTFAKMPNIWEAILQAGGPLETAQLDNITIVRGSGAQGQTIPVNLTAYFNDLTKLPELRPNDNVYVPNAGPASGAGGPNGGGNAGFNLFARRKVVYIYGAVASPGRYQLEENMDVLQAIIIAGGPATALATTGANSPAIVPNLKEVKIISHSDDGPVVYRVDLEKYAKEAVPVPLILRPGDTIFIPARDAYGRFLFTNTLRTVLTSTISILISAVIINNLRR